MNVVHLTASTFHGGPERQMLGLAHHLPETDQTGFLSFTEGGRCRQFLSTARHHGFEAVGLTHDTPRWWSAVREIAEQIEHFGADVLCCHGYKANLLGRMAARRVQVPAVAVARGWTGESFKVRLYERLDRFHLRWMDHVVCVSEAQAAKARRAGVRPERISVIYNAIDAARFQEPDERYRAKLLRYFRQPRTHIIGAAGRLSPEKGFDVLIEAAKLVLSEHPSAGFVVFGDGAERARLQQQINAVGIGSSFVLAGFRADLDRFLPHFDLMVLPSHTEGLPNAVLEAFGAGVPVVATAVGGTPEIIEDGESGFLVPAGDAAKMAERVSVSLDNAAELPEMGRKGRMCVQEKFGFAMQAHLYRELFARLCPDPSDDDDGATDEFVDSPEDTAKPATMPAIDLDDLLPTESTCNR
ncbi:MAG TPA: glycosyltransferase [Gemmataceae bacterium]|jgi:glycosyltransferase involved in cell wall biosynthesis